MESLVLDLLLTAGQKTAAHFGAKVATSIASTLVGIAVNTAVQKKLSEGLAEKAAEGKTEEVKAIQRRNLLVSCIINGTAAGLGTVAYKSIGNTIDASNIIGGDII